ncbi:hypothetical protein SCB29_36415, partial [Paraburkholderia sp. SIMBA_055]
HIPADHVDDIDAVQQVLQKGMRDHNADAALKRMRQGCATHPAMRAVPEWGARTAANETGLISTARP